MSRLALSTLLTLLLGCPAPKDPATDEPEIAVDRDGDGSPAGEDCDDSDPAVSPYAAEVCDGLDNDCDGLTDDADASVTGQSTFYADSDGDGYGDPAVSMQMCAAAPGVVSDNTDHDDTNGAVWYAPDTYVGDVTSGFTTFCTGYAERRIEGNLDLSGATQADVDALVCLTEVTGDLSINLNAALMNVDGLSALTAVGSDLHISDNTALTNVDGLSALTEVTGDLNISENDQLTNIDGLSTITAVGGDLSIRYNAALTNVDGLSALTEVTGDLSIKYNAALCQSSVDALLLQLAGFGYAGATHISGNDSGC